jgi:CHAT domain-containing protein
MMVVRTSIWIFVFVICILLQTGHPFQYKQETTELKIGKPITRELVGGEEHFYKISLSNGEYANVVVAQKGIDLVVDLKSNGETIATFDEEYTINGNEIVQIVAEHPGKYEFRVAPRSRSATPGNYEIRVTEVRIAGKKDRLLDEAIRLKGNFDHLFKDGRYEEARQTIERALSISEGVLGPEDPYIASLLFQLAYYYEETQDFAMALQLLKRALLISKKTLGDEHPRTIEITRLLAYVNWQTNEIGTAERLSKFAYDASKRILGEHYLTAQCSVTLAQITRDLKKKEQLLQSALDITERTVGVQHYSAANLLNELGLLYKNLGDDQKGEQFLLQSMEIRKKTYGPTNINLVIGLHNLGLIAHERKNYELAEEYYSKSIQIVETAFGPHNPRLLLTLNNLANIYRAKGEYSKSLDTHLRVLKISEVTKGPYHPMTLTSLGNIARTYAAQQNIEEAIRFQARVDAVIARNMELNLAIGSEQEKVSYMNWIPERTDRTVSLNSRLAPDRADARALAALVLLQRKGRVLDAMSESYASLRQRAVPEAQVLFQQLNETTAQLANLVLNGPQIMTFDQHQTKVSELENEKEKLEADISHLSSEFRAQSQPVTLSGIHALIPENAALIEFAIYRPFDPKAGSNKDAYKEPRYIAYVLNHRGEIRWHDLGDVVDIDTEIQIFRKALRDPKRNDVKQISRKVDQKIMEPLRGSIGSATHLLISPDGPLNLIPFEALVDQENRYLIERFACTYLTSGRDLLRLKESRNSNQSTIVLADPVFGEPEPTSLALANLPEGSSAKRESVTIGTDLSEVYFSTLTGTAQEAKAIKTSFVEARVLTGFEASETSLKQASAPRILHIATHGFFLSDAGSAKNNDDRVINPLLRSGLALAGANLRRNEKDDGILTALEASGMNLWGTKLVTLSACDTGVGEVKNGEGVYGLRRAFLLAGAESLVMSLWPVSDYVSREIMSDYYQGLKNGLGRGEALRQVQLSMMTNKKRNHPFYWASFVQLGEWRSL